MINVNRYVFGKNQAVVSPYLADLVAYYKFDSNSNDFSGNSHNGTDTSISYSNAGKVGNSATFNGTSSNISVPNSPDFDFSGVSSDVPFSISVWLYVTNTSLRYVIGRGSSSANQQFDISINPNLAVYLYSGSGANGLGRGIGSDHVFNAWEHFVITYNGSSTIGGLKIYRNGFLVPFGGGGGSNISYGTYTKMPASTDPLYIGRRSYGAVGYFSGGQDELAIWKNRILTPTEVLDIYNKGMAGNALI